MPPNQIEIFEPWVTLIEKNIETNAPLKSDLRSVLVFGQIANRGLGSYIVFYLISCNDH